MTTEELIYLAGFFDGEGTATVKRIKNKNYRFGIYFQPIVFITNTNLEILEEIKKITGTGIIINLKNLNPHWKSRYNLQISGQEARAFLKNIFSYLRMKKVVAEEVCNFPFFNGHYRTENDFNIQELAFNRIKGLNKRGIA